MLPIVSILLVVTFLISIASLFFLIWSISTGQFSMGPDAPKVIFDKHELGHSEEPAGTSQQQINLNNELVKSDRYPDADDGASREDLKLRLEIDDAARWPVLFFVISAVAWLLLGSLFGLIVSLKFHWPDWLNQVAPLTFGVLRPLHLNTVIY